MRRRGLALIVGVLLGCAALAYGAEPHAIRKGEPLAAALQALQQQGLQLIFSSTLVGPDLRVTVEPGSGSAESIARRILAPHGLTLDGVRPGLFAVVRSRPDAPRDASETQTVIRTLHPAAEPVYEVDVYASRYKIEQQESTAALAELTREDLQALPGLNEDALRVTRFLPGTAANALSARSHVRGGREDELAVYFDGVPLFEPFHYKDVQSLLGILDPESISTLDFYSGVFPARYGNRLSGVLDIAPRTWSGQNHHALGASLLYSHGLTQGRLDSYPLEWLASVRRGNVDLVTDLIDRDETEPEFLDALGRLELDLGPRSNLVAGWLLLDDDLGVHFKNRSERGEIGYRDATGWLSWRIHPRENTDLRITASRTERHTSRVGSVDQPASSRGSVDDQRRFDTNTLRVEGNTKLPVGVGLTAGLEWYDYEASYLYRSATAFEPLLAAALGRPASIARSTALEAGGEAYAAYASAAVSITHAVTLDMSFRWDAQRFDGAFDDDQFQPRISVQYDYDPSTTFRVSWGRAAQPTRPDELPVEDGEVTFPAVQRATQIALSMEHWLAPGARLRIEAYDKRVRDPSPSYENLLDPFALLPELEVDRVRIQPDSSRLYGAELSLRWQLPESWSGWTSYSWSQATDRFGAVRVPRTWDQKHALATGVAWTQGSWQLSTNLTWHTGWRRNQLTQTASGVVLEPRNADDWPSYVSLDVRAAWHHRMHMGALDAFVEIDNVTNHNNACCSRYTLTPAGTLDRQDSSWLPRLFLAGISWQLP